MSLPADVGTNLFAYQRARGVRDALAYMILTLLKGFKQGMNFALYCLDLLGHFDRINTRLMIEQLYAKGMLEDMINLFEAWLGNRQAIVLCGGQQKDPI